MSLFKTSVLVAFLFTVSVHALETPTPTTSTNETQVDRTKISVLDKDFVLKLYPFNLILGGMRGDFLFNTKSSWLVGPYAENIHADWGVYKSIYWGAGVASSYHFGKSPMEHGFYLAPEIGYKQGQVGLDYGIVAIEGNFTDYHGALTAGYHWSWSALNLWLGAGASYHRIEVSSARGKFRLFGAEGETDPTTEKASTSYVGLTFDFALGIPF